MLEGNVADTEQAAKVTERKEAGESAVPAVPAAEPGGPRRKTNLERLAVLRENPDETLVESESKRCAVLLHMINELRDAGAWSGNTALQLTMFLIVKLDNPGFEYRYYLDMGGPNCRDLQGDINWLGSDCYHCEHHPYGRNFLVLPKGEDFLRRFPATIEQCGPSVDRAVGIAGSRQLPELRYLTVAMYLMLSEEGKSMSPYELVEFYHRVRALAKTPLIEKAFEEAGELLAKSAAGQEASA